MVRAFGHLFKCPMGVKCTNYGKLKEKVNFLEEYDMCRIVMSYIVCVVVVLSMAMKVSAVTNEWTNATGDRRWSTPGNWLGGVPVMQPNDEHGRPTINMSGDNAPVIDGTMPQGVCQWLHVGNGPQGGTLNVLAGGVIGQPIWGPGETFLGEGGNAVINIDGPGSLLRSEGWRIATLGDSNTSEYPGTVTINITNGGTMVMVWWRNYIGSKGTINIINGTLRELGSWGLDIHDGGKINMNGNNAMIEFEEVNPDPCSMYKVLEGLLAAGKITSGSPRCQLTLTKDTDGLSRVRLSGCACTTFSPMDFNHDCYVDFRDFAAFAGNWLSCINPIDANCL